MTIHYVTRGARQYIMIQDLASAARLCSLGRSSEEVLANT
jgi:hypothetical protein